jgi:hypothetical protein
VYLPIHLNIFAKQTLEGYILFTHHCPQNILYHISTNELIISKGSLTLIGMARHILITLIMMILKIQLLI